MASYPDTEQALLDLLQAQCGYDDATSSRGDYRVMDAPGADTSLVLAQSADSEYDVDLDEAGSHGESLARYRIGIVVARKRKQDADGAAYVALQAATEAVVSVLNRYPRLNGATDVKNADIVAVRPPIIRRDSPHLIQLIDLQIVVYNDQILEETPA